MAILGTDPSVTQYPIRSTEPVQTTSWYHAIAFCNKLSIAEGLDPAYSVTGVDFASLPFSAIPTDWNTDWNAATCNWSANGYRLPTQMEWFWAAMGADSGNPGVTNTTGYNKPFAGSNGTNAIGDYAWYGFFSGGSATLARTNIVGDLMPNELGLYDMSGNVWEWCWDWYEESYPLNALTDYHGPETGLQKVLRGGCWSNSASSMALDRRHYYAPNSGASFGFRVVRP